VRARDDEGVAADHAVPAQRRPHRLTKASDCR
jgi:hypothetical protein